MTILVSIRIKLKTFLHYHRDSELHESGLLQKLKAGLKNFAKKLARILRLPWGGEIILPLQVPKPIMEGSEQIGKKGGEIAEAFLAMNLLKMLEKVEWATPPTMVEIPSPGTEKPLNPEAYFKKEKAQYIQSEKKLPRDKQGRIRNWEKMGVAGAQSVFNQLMDKIGPMSKIHSVKIGIGGIGLTGYEKADVLIKVKKATEQDFHDELKLSLKATEGDPRKAGLDVALQTGEAGILFSLMTDMSPTEAKVYKNVKKDEIMADRNKVVNELKKVIDTLNTTLKDLPRGSEEKKEVQAKIKEIKDQQKAVKDKAAELRATYKNKYDDALKDIYAESGIDPDAYDDVSEMMTWFEKWASYDDPRNMRKDVEMQPVYDHIIDHMSNIEKVIKARFRTDPEGMIKRLLNLGGIEDGLDYVKMGLLKDGSAFVAHTLDNKQYHDTINNLFDKQILKGMRIDTEIKGESLLVHLHSAVEDKDIFTFSVFKRSNNSRISLPQIEIDGKLKPWLQSIEDHNTEK